MVQSKEVMERNIHACDEGAKWQLAEQVQSIVERSKALEQAERENKCPKRAFKMSR